MRYREYKSPEEVETTLYIEHPRKRGVFLPVHRRPMRLPGIDYSSPDCICFVTFNLHPQCRERLMGKVGEIAWHWLWREVNRIGCKVFAACMMPDHVHILLAPSGRGESVSDIVRCIKTMICTQLRRRLGVYLKWQSSFYDHVLREWERREEEFEAIVGYIYENPVRAGLEEDYPFRYKCEFRDPPR